jgi:GT2 family glycosyltransferase
MQDIPAWPPRRAPDENVESAALALQAATSRQRLAEAEAEISRLQEEIRLYRESTSWRITAPLRFLATLLGRRRRSAVSHRAAPPAAVPVGVAKAALRADFSSRLLAFLAGSARLHLPRGEPPDVSILLVLHNQAELTFACLSSIADCLGGSEVAAEIVIVDNASADATADLLARLDGATIVRGDENLHFLRGANRAAREARGRHLLLLNNDAQLRPGALEAALAALESGKNVGAVGGRIVLPDGTLQEAGCIVWRDGTCAGYARGRAPDDPEVLFRRDVDFCSGAFLLTRRELFERLGGFDERFAPAYYEETDYCVRLWQLGFRVVYEPDAVVLHYEFGSAADSADALRQQRRNLEVFRARHRAWLAKQLPRAPENLLAARQVGARIPRVLVVEDRVPHPTLGAGYPRANDFLRALAAYARVTLFPMQRVAETLAGVRASLPAEVEVLTDRDASGLAEFLRQRRGFYDAILVCRAHNMRRFVESGGAEPALRGNARIIYDAEAISATRETRRWETAGTPLPPAESERLLAEEIALARRADVVLAVSAAEQRVFAEHGVADARVLGHALRATPTETPFEARKEILFVGAVHADWTPNADSLRWFAEEILPPLRRALGMAIRLKLVGENRVAAIAELDGIAFDLAGVARELRPHYESARLVVAPTRFAAGLPHKVAQAAAHGVPVVATELLARQLGWVPGRDLLAASDAAGFAAECARLFVDAALWQRLRASALDRVREDCAPERFAATVADLVADIPVRR